MLVNELGRFDFSLVVGVFLSAPAVEVASRHPLLRLALVLAALRPLFAMAVKQTTTESVVKCVLGEARRLGRILKVFVLSRVCARMVSLTLAIVSAPLPSMEIYVNTENAQQGCSVCITHQLTHAFLVPLANTRRYQGMASAPLAFLVVPQQR